MGTETKARKTKLSKSRLDDLVEEATVDAHDDWQQVTGLYTMLEEHLALPFETQVLGVDVVVADIALSDSNDILVVCKRGQHRQSLPILELPLPSPPPAGWEWIEAYRHWARRCR